MHTSCTLTLDLAPTITELGWAAVSSVTAEARHPGEESASVTLPAPKLVEGKWALDVPLVRGMAMVTLRLH